MTVVNFAAKPFHGHNPLLYGFWLVNVALLLGMGWASWRWLDLRNQNKASHHELAQLRDDEAELAREMQSTLSALRNIDIKAFDREITEFAAIQQSLATNWVRLMDDLAQLVNADVRIVRIESQEGNQEEMPLAMRAEARRKEAQLDFIRALQANPAFQHVRLESETYQGASGSLRFELRFAYREGQP